jgi:hypothetical protein
MMAQLLRRNSADAPPEAAIADFIPKHLARITILYDQKKAE